MKFAARVTIMALTLVLTYTAISEAGVFRRRNGERRTPIRSILGCGC